MGSNMEGNWQLQPLCAEKPLVAKGTTHSFKRTFPLHHTTGRVLITDAASDEEVLLEQNSARYAGIKLMRGVWEEDSYESSGTFFPLALADEGVVWSSAGHCLKPSARRKWRCGYGTDLLPLSPLMRPLHRTIVDLGWLTAGCNANELAEHIPSQPSQRIADADVMPDFGFMMTDVPEGEEVKQLFIPSPRQLAAGDPVCLLGFAHHPNVSWARTFLRTEADFAAAVRDAQRLHHSPPSPTSWRLDENTAFWRLQDMKDGVCYPSRLAASPGQIVAASERMIEHTCSTFQGMSGAPGVDIHTPWQLLFVHTRADADFRRNNYGYSVHHPMFVKAYEREVLPKLLATPSHLLTPEMLRCLRQFLLVHEHQLVDKAVLHELERRC